MILLLQKQQLRLSHYSRQKKHTFEFKFILLSPHGKIKSWFQQISHQSAPLAVTRWSYAEWGSLGRFLGHVADGKPGGWGQSDEELEEEYEAQARQARIRRGKKANSISSNWRWGAAVSSDSTFRQFSARTSCIATSDGSDISSECLLVDSCAHNDDKYIS